jgi:hypothetical protein
MAVVPMRVLSDTQVYWPPGNTGFPLLVRRGSLVSIDQGNADLVAAYGGAANLEDMTGLPGDGTTLDTSWLAN